MKVRLDFSAGIITMSFADLVILIVCTSGSGTPSGYEDAVKSSHAQAC